MLARPILVSLTSLKVNSRSGWSSLSDLSMTPKRREQAAGNAEHGQRASVAEEVHHYRGPLLQWCTLCWWIIQTNLLADQVSLTSCSSCWMLPDFSSHLISQVSLYANSKPLPSLAQSLTSLTHLLIHPPTHSLMHPWAARNVGNPYNLLGLYRTERMDTQHSWLPKGM